jgi:uncharacterized protein
MRRFLFTFVVLVVALVTSVARATPYVPPPIAGHVTDTAGKLTSSEIAALDDKLAGYRKCSGNHIAVFFARSLEGNSVEDVAYITFNAWKIGDAKKDNGVLLVLAPSERKIRIETGKGDGGQLTDLESAHILRDVVGPNMKAERFFAAADQATTRIGSALGGCAIADIGGVASTDAPPAPSPAPYVPPPAPPAPDLHVTERVWMAVGIAFLVLLAGVGLSRSGVRGIGPSLFFTAVVTFISVVFMSIVGHKAFDEGFDLDAASLVFGLEALLLVFINIGVWIHRFRGGSWASTSGWTGSSSSDWSSGSSSSSSSSSSFSSSSSSFSSSSSSSDYSGGGGSSGGGGASDSY